MKLTTKPMRPALWKFYAQQHLDQADDCLRLTRQALERGDHVSASFWTRIWKEKQQDAENLKRYA